MKGQWNEHILSTLHDGLYSNSKTADKNQTIFIVYGLSLYYRMHFRPIYQLTVVWKTKSENLYSPLDPSSTSNEFKVSMKY